MTRRGFAALVARGGVGLAFIAAGCGGGGSNSSGSAPTAATRSRVLSMHDTSVRGTLQSGFQSESFAFARNNYIGGGYGGGGAGAGAPASADSGSTMPMLGAFLRNIASAAPSSRAAHLKAFRSRSRQEDGGDGEHKGGEGEEGGGGDDGLIYATGGGHGEYYDMPSFYFDYYLGLWVQIDETGGNYNYLLFDDEAKTKPAGHITTVNPTDWETFPQIFKSSYSFDSGYLAGSHGDSENITNADYSGSSTYVNVYADGWKDSGSSRWSAQGNFTWSSRTDGANDEWSETSGSFFADGSGGTRLSSSDGYKSDYRYNADGSGRGRITGPDPGLPVTISWDAYGNTTITYADGTVERINGWGSGYGGGYVGGGGDDPMPIDIEGPIK